MLFFRFRDEKRHKGKQRCNNRHKLRVDDSDIAAHHITRRQDDDPNDIAKRVRCLFGLEKQQNSFSCSFHFYNVNYSKEFRIMTQEDESIKQKEEKEFLIHHWKCLNKYRAKDRMFDGVLCLGVGKTYPHNPESTRILINLVDKGYLKFHRRPDPNETRPVYPADRCFEFTECGEKLAKYL